MSKEWVYRIAIGVILLVGGYIGQCQYSRYSRFEAKAKQAESLVRVLKAQTDSAAQQIALLEAKQARVDTVVVVRKRKVTQVDTIPAPDTCKTWIAARDSLITALGEQNGVLGEENGVLKGANTLLILSRDELSKALSARTHPPKVLGIFPAPSRTTVFAVGAIVGFLVSSQLK